MTGAGEGALLEARGVTVSFGGILALDAVSFAVGNDEVLGLIGPNGAGKTTLMNVLSGFQKPTAGEVLIGGRPATTWGPERIVRSDVSRTFQSVRSFPALTVAENVELGAIGIGQSRRRARKRVERILAALHLTHRRDERAEMLPPGEERRLGIARALASEPRILLLDEPAAGSNEAESAELVAALRAIRAEFGCSLLVIEHDMAVIMSLCDRVHVLNFGRSVMEGTPAQVQRDPAVLEAYLGHPATSA